ncbi:tRNA (N6-threonylcarbamoyladenosine(37)-N6)-methyltransferase TrmO [Acinetobacter schindleri]|uniref:tRNA (N6-threonylcarbamoyladenosine(37)-N6)-methyltransferase TrmO n=1 Tax=Acinetobacter TaxID=469 RepID=UPI00205EE3B1|nr:tRNA (N6-threonylcarbamoyladenosine(37)-N6)-methyltransferase TrmO [Acinetobacter schindleri]MCU4323480.1 tRNA (N6-threonylcarbamoyladenosine(37)-N6)-methyltransferase TrmO [Acinetobacter schindleri]MCU4520638.1 tRNA (N6-threonylcarbamoyladenosine(37)-N6)-methyltransferase TrmO [Acinetobacter schindleri]UOH75949.1 tRNA (N6-threonylcarbamoyladenosine(37)-N6)-methyltransferase TrmO [Acinetobacter schindleri]
MTELTIPVIGIMKSPYKEKFGIPRQPNLVEVESYIEMQAPYNDLLAFEGIEEFSHLWLLWQFHDNKNQENSKFRPQVRPPRLGGNQKIGVFATRSMYRPSPIGLSVVKLKEVKKVGKTVRVYVTGSDLLEGTPIVDIKPYIHYSDAVMEAQSGYAQEEPVRKYVVWSEQAELEREQLVQTKGLSEQVIRELAEVLSLDPRPAYQENPERIYGMRFADFNIKFIVNETSVLIVEIE